MSPPPTKGAMAEPEDRAKTEFASRKFAWTEAVCLDARLSAHRKTVGILLLAMVNHKTGYAWPSVGKLAALSNGSEKAARDAINDLERLGYLRTQRGGGRNGRGEGIPSRFWPIWPRSKTPVTDALRALKGGAADEQPPLGGEGYEGEEPPLQRDAPSPYGVNNPHRGVGQTLQLNPATREHSSDPNGSADAVAPATKMAGWKREAAA